MTLRTSAVAVCCWSDSRSSLEQARVLDGDDGLRSEVSDQLNLFVGERADLLAVESDGTNQLVFLSASGQLAPCGHPQGQQDRLRRDRLQDKAGWFEYRQCGQSVRS